MVTTSEKDTNEEVFKDIKGYEGLYKISNKGNVYSLNRNRLKETRLNINGYKRVLLYKNSKQKQCAVHRLVAEAFLPNPLGLPQINHKDGNKLNNAVENLEWCSPRYNMKHAVANNLIKTIGVTQYTKGNVMIRKWASMSEAGRETGIGAGNISNACSPKYKKKTAGGYIWRYSI